MASAPFEGHGDGSPVVRLGNLDRNQTRSSVLLFVAEVCSGEQELFHTFWFTNTEVRPGSLFNLPRTSLSLTRDGELVVVTNTGDKPAIGVNVSAPGHTNKLIVSDNYFWLWPGESREVRVNLPHELAADCWNKHGNPYMEP